MKLILLSTFLEHAIAAQIRVGIIGTDTSHVPAFTQMLNDPAAANYIPGARIVAAYRRAAVTSSKASRVSTSTRMKSSKYGVEIVPDIPALLAKVDAVILASVDGPASRPGPAGNRGAQAVFIDKPLAASYEDAKEIARLARGMPAYHGLAPHRCAGARSRKR